MATKWTPQAITELAIAKLEEQQKDLELREYGTPEHLAVIRYGVLECCDATTGKLDKEKLKAWFAAESAFLGYASNAKKMLIEHGTMAATEAKEKRGYE